MRDGVAQVGITSPAKRVVAGSTPAVTFGWRSSVVEH